MRCAAFLLLAAACSSGLGLGEETSLQPGNPTPAGDAQVWLDTQNAVRRNARPTPSPALPALTWSSPAADVAQALADGCTYQHMPDAAIAARTSPPARRKGPGARPMQ